MHADHVALAERNNFQVSAACVSNNLPQGGRGSRRRIFLLRMVTFEDLPRILMLQYPGCGSRHFEKQVYADREVCGIEESGLTVFDQFAHPFELAVPARRSHHRVLARADTSFDIPQ